MINTLQQEVKQANRELGEEAAIHEAIRSDISQVIQNMIFLSVDRM